MNSYNLTPNYRLGAYGPLACGFTGQSRQLEPGTQSSSHLHRYHYFSIIGARGMRFSAQRFGADPDAIRLDHGGSSDAP